MVPGGKHSTRNGGDYFFVEVVLLDEIRETRLRLGAIFWNLAHGDIIAS
jgi:hypothetical protein